MYFALKGYLRHWPFYLALLLFLGSTGCLLVRMLGLTGGRLIYSLDDPYIHMAMAKNLSRYGVWGVTRYEFSSSSSSPLWTLVLSAVYLLTGPNDAVPLVLNVLLAAGCLWTLHATTSAWKPWNRAVFLCGFVLAVPLPSIALTGMEHTLHIMLSVLFLSEAIREMAKSQQVKMGWKMPALAALLVGTRYEGLFLVGVVFLLCLWKRRHKQAMITLAAALAPVAVMGLISHGYGWPVFPTSILLKANKPHMHSLAGMLATLDMVRRQSLSTPAVPGLIACLWLISLIGPYRRRLTGPGIVTAVCFLHLAFARVGWLFRYEAYIVALIVFAAALQLSQRPVENRGARTISLALLLIVLLFPAAERSYKSLEMTPKASRNIYDQHYQMASFISRFYPGQSVAVNDIGMVNFLADFRCLDLLGLGSLDAYRYQTAPYDPHRTLAELTKPRGVKIAVIHEAFFGGEVPGSWYRAGRLMIPENVIAATDTIAFYAVDPSEKRRLIDHLKAFSKELPAEVNLYP